MPTRAPRLCPGCGQQVVGKCLTCYGAWSTSTRPGSTRASRKRRKKLLARQPICAAPGCEALATEDDHIVGWSQAMARGWTLSRWDAPSNHQGLCRAHHQQKTAAEAKGQGRPW